MTSITVPAPLPGQPWSGYPPAALSGAPAPARTGHTKLLALLVSGLAVVVVAVVAVASLATPTHRVVVCPPECGRPPTGQPISTLPRFTGNGSFSVEYLPASSGLTVTPDADGVTEVVRDGSAIRLFGVAAQNSSANQIVAAFLQRHFPGATRKYVLPNAVVGYQPGFGEVDDVYPQDSTGAYTHNRVIVVAAVKNGEALVAVAAGPYDQFDPNGDNNGHPSGADLRVALALDPLVNSFTWRGDPPR